ncbi:MAG: 6-carboxytetrahydropterin synthase [Gemmatimonadetes bacterium]|nr:6-carboxytetrahydropterin synthase [Gemmatimonadota bacterium]
MSNAFLTRSVRFSASHRYFRPEWSEERNRETFGSCTNAPGHGHNYECVVTVSGPLDHETSMVLDLKVFDRILHDEIANRLDHQHINDAEEEFAYGKTIPTAEALAVFFFQKVAARLPEGVQLYKVRVQEDANLYADCLGPD